MQQGSQAAGQQRQNPNNQMMAQQGMLQQPQTRIQSAEVQNGGPSSEMGLNSPPKMASTTMQLASSQTSSQVSSFSTQANVDRVLMMQSGDAASSIQQPLSSHSTQHQSMQQVDPKEISSGLRGSGQAVQQGYRQEASSSRVLQTQNSRLGFPVAVGSQSSGNSQIITDVTEGRQANAGALSGDFKEDQGSSGRSSTTGSADSFLDNTRPEGDSTAQPLGSMTSEQTTQVISTNANGVGWSTGHAYPDHVSGYAVGDSDSPNNSNTGTSVTQSRSSSSLPASNGEVNKLSKPKHGKFSTQQDFAECNPLQPQEKQVSATWLSSFPGSGSKMTWQLIQAITGLSTGDDLDSNGQVANGVAVAVKTHYPSHSRENVFNQSKFQGISRAILVLRNPMHAIPALFRFIYFVEQQNERDGKSEPPTTAWISWRNEYFETELQLWVNHIQWWLDNYKRENLHLLPFEYLISPERGSDELQKIGNFLGSADPVVASNLLEPEKFCCVWEKVVDQDEIKASSKLEKPIYTVEQLESLIQALLKLRDNNESFPELSALMDGYLVDIVVIKKAVLAMNKKKS